MVACIQLMTPLYAMVHCGWIHDTMLRVFRREGQKRGKVGKLKKLLSLLMVLGLFFANRKMLLIGLFNGHHQSEERLSPSVCAAAFPSYLIPLLLPFSYPFSLKTAAVADWLPPLPRAAHLRTDRRVLIRWASSGTVGRDDRNVNDFEENGSRGSPPFQFSCSSSPPTTFKTYSA